MKPSWPLTSIMFVITILPCMFIMLLLGGYLTFSQYRTLNQNIITTGYQITQQLANPTVFNSLIQDKRNLQEFIHGMYEHDAVRSISLFDEEANLLAYTGPHHFSISEEHIREHAANKNTTVHLQDKEDVLVFTAPIVSPVQRTYVSGTNKQAPTTTPQAAGQRSPLAEHKILGWAVVEIIKGPTLVKQYELIYVNCTIILLGTVLLILLNRRLARRFTRPLNTINEQLEKLKRGDFVITNKPNIPTPSASSIWLLASSEFSAINDNLYTIGRILQNSNDHYFRQYEQQTLELQENLARLEVRNVEIEHQRKNAVKESRQKTELVASMQHEIRTPLSSLVSFVELFAETKLSPFQQEYLSRARIALRTLSENIDELMGAMLFDSDRFILAHSPLDLRECVDEALLLIAPHAYQLHTELACYIHTDVPKRLLGDSARLKQLILHFIGALLQICQSGSEIIIKIKKTAEVDDTLTLSIELQCKSLILDLIAYEKLVKRYLEINNDDANIYQNQTLAKRLVEALGGEIFITQDPEQDIINFAFTCNFMRLPFAEEFPFEESFQELKALIFDENANICEIIAQQFRTLGVTTTKINEATAFERLVLHHNRSSDISFDIILLGINPTKASEHAFRFFLEKIRRYYTGYILVAINSSEARLLEDLEFCGADVCLVKPVANKKLQVVLYDLFKGETDYSRQPSEQLIAQLGNKQILIVEDNPTILKRFVDMFQQEGVKVVTANCGKQAVTLAKQFRYDLIFLDIRLPDIDGFDVAKQIRQLRQAQHTPLIAVSAYLSAKEEEILQLTGFDDVLIKPVKRSEIHAIVVKWVKSSSGQLHKGHTNHKEETMSPQHQSQTIAPHEIIDWAAAVAAVNHNPKIAKEILSMLLDSLSEFKTTIETAFQAQDFKTLLDQVHKLHGSASYCGVPRLKNAAYQLEKQLRTENFTNLEPLVQQLLIAIAEVPKAAGEYIG